MLLDTQCIFSNEQSITTGTITSDNIVKFGKGDVSYVPFIIQVVKDFSNLTSLKVKVQTSYDEDFSEPVDLVESTLELASLKEGNKFPISFLPKGNLGYMRLQYIVDGTDETTGKITAGVVAGCDLGFHEII